MAASLMWAATRERSMRGGFADSGQTGRRCCFSIGARCRRSVLDWCIQRNRSRLRDLRRMALDRFERAVVVEEFVEHALDRVLDRIRTAVPHVGVRVAGLLADLLIRNDARIGLEDRILRTEREDLQSAVGQ